MGLEDVRLRGHRERDHADAALGTSCLKVGSGGLLFVFGRTRGFLGLGWSLNR